MLFYLDNWLSADPNARIPERLRAGAFRRAQNSIGGNAAAQLPAKARRPRGLNENYARELMELHTLGVDGGYTQNDVTEVARCFTGWTMRNPRQGGGFQFVDFLHDNGEKTVLGRRIPAGGGMKDGEAVLQMLSEHPSTAAFISTKLCQRFVSDNPPQALVRRCADTFLKTKGDIRQVLAAIFTSREFYSSPGISRQDQETVRARSKRPARDRGRNHSSSQIAPGFADHGRDPLWVPTADRLFRHRRRMDQCRRAAGTSEFRDCLWPAGNCRRPGHGCSTGRMSRRPTIPG